MSVPGQAAASVLAERLGVVVDPELLVLSLTHRSFANEAGGLPTNERLEFLGDSVLGIVVTDKLFRDHPELPESNLARMRAASVSQLALSRVARELGLGQYVLLGKGETMSGGADKDSILADTLEALFGAIYIAQGIETAREVILRLMGPTLDAAASAGLALDWKTALQEACTARDFGLPVYATEGTGPPHDAHFTATVTIDGVVHGRGAGRAKKYAEQEAAEQAHASITAAHPLPDASD